jgi:hypothetical protein
VLFTKIWTAVLAVLATACLAGMYLLSTGSAGGFTDADKTAVRAVTEAGMAALVSDINSSPVSLGPSLLSDTRLKEGLAGPVVVPEDDVETMSLQDVLDEVANESLLNEHPRMSMAIVDKSGTILARTGLSPELFDELTKLPAFSTALDNNEAAPLLSATIGSKLHAVKLSRGIVEAHDRRLVTIAPVELGGGSFFRRVVGTQNPAGLVRDGAVVGDVIGSAKADELTAFVAQSMSNVPSEGASSVFQIGEGADARIGAAARVPGTAGKGQSGTFFVVLSSHTLGSTHQDMASALRLALDSGGLAQLNWPLVAGLLVISLGLTFYLPHIEFKTPMRRLASEFHAITEARQHELHHDTYGGEFGLLARSATTAMEALRVSWENELMDSDAELSDVAPRRTRSTRSLRSARGPRRAGRTRGHEAIGSESGPEFGPDSDPEAIDLPPAAAPVVAERPARGPVVDEAAPAPAFSDELEPALPLGDSSDSVSLADVGDDRESYYRRIFDEFVETKVACGEAIEGFTYEKFAKKLRKQSDSLLGRDDVSDVQFSVYVKDGKAALRAKVIKT